MYINKEVLVDRIKVAAQSYNQHLAGKTFMFLYEEQEIEVMFKIDSFMHLTGVSSSLYPKDFYKKAKRGSLKTKEIGFDWNHPADLADIKTQYLSRLYELTIKDILIAMDIGTMTATYTFGLTNLEIILCCGKNTDRCGNIISNCYVPYSFRIENIDNNKFGELYDVKYIFSKQTSENKYSKMTYGEKEKLHGVNEEIKVKLDYDKICTSR